MQIPPVDLDILERDFAQLQRRGVSYGLGAKAPASLLRDPKADLSAIKKIDCSGFFRLAFYRSTGGVLIPDGSQNQRAWAEMNLRKVAYRDAARYMTDKRLFACFIKPFENGCGSVGHVWFMLNADKDADAETFESHGGTGINSRSWNTRVLMREVYSCFELPTVQGAK